MSSTADVSPGSFDGYVTALPTPTSRVGRLAHRRGWTAGVAVLLAVLFVWRVAQLPRFGSFELRTIVAGTLPLAVLAMAQAVIVISGGIDLSAGSLMVLANCLAAQWMQTDSILVCGLVALAVVAVTAGLSTINGIVVAVSGIPDIIVTLASSFSLAGLALFVLPSPVSGVNPEFQKYVAGELDVPAPAIIWIGILLLVVWLPLRLSRLGLSIYAIGSDRKSAFLSGVAIGRTRVAAYALGGVFAGLAGLASTASTLGGDARATIGTNATLNSVAAIVLGGVALTGGVGGLLGPVLAALILTLIPAIMLGLGWDPSNAETARGVVIITVLAVAGLLQARRNRPT